MLDILIVGSGPAGLATAIAASASGLDYLVVDKGGITSNIARFQRDMPFFSTPELLEIGGIPFIVPNMRPTSLDCVNYYRGVAVRYGVKCRFHTRVTSVSGRKGAFNATTDGGEGIAARNVVLATGYYDTPKKLGVPGEDLPHVSSWYADPLPYFQRNVLIVGGKNSAVEAALDLWRHGAHVRVVHRGDSLSPGIKYWILPDFENRVKDGSIALTTGATVTAFRKGVTLLKEKGGKVTEHPTDFAFTLIGYRADTEFLGACGIEIDPETGGPVHDTGTMQTGIPGLYVAGGMVGGRFNNKIFIENGRRHGDMIVRSVLARF
jgi:thioredoxin reductase (NADPH)